MITTLVTDVDAGQEILDQLQVGSIQVILARKHLEDHAGLQQENTLRL